MELYGVKRELAFCGFPPDLQFWNSSKRMRGYAGVGVLISKDFPGGPPIKVEYDGFGEPGLHDAEGRTLTLHFKHFLLVVTYVPNAGVWRSENRVTPGSSILGLERLEYRVEQWDKDFQRFLKQKLERETRKPVFVCGDMNCSYSEIDIFKSKAHRR